MKRLKLLFLLLPILCLVSCNDESGEYVNQLFTEQEMVTALKQCVTACVDTANAHLSVVEVNNYGFESYSSGIYKIGLPIHYQYVIDSLVQHGHSELIASFGHNLNVAASSCGNAIRNYVTTSLADFNFISPLALLHGDSVAIVDFFYTMSQVSFLGMLKSQVSLQPTYREAETQWNEICTLYQQYTGQNISLDLRVQVAEQMLYGIYEEMKREEILIRTDVSHRGNSTGKMYSVFGNFEK